jgi:hypothetical protein
MDAMCTYVHLCASVPQEQSQAASFIERRSKAAKAIDSTTRQLQTLSNALIDEEAMATRQYGFLDLNKELRGIVSLMAASVEAIQQIQKIRQHSFYLDRMIGHYALLIRKARSGILSPPHPKGRRATAADAEHILPLLHEAMTGSAPSQAIEVYYRENNTSRDMARFFHEETKAKLQKLIDGLNCIIPGFEERIGTEPLEDIPKTPVQVPVSPDCAEILWLADIHSAYIHSHNQGGFLDLAQALLEMLSACGPGISGTRDNSARS